MVTKGTPIVAIGTMRIQDMAELERVANITLREAMINERSKRWKKVIHNYKQLVCMLNKRNFPPDVPVPPWYSMLMYETHYHLGIALQQVGEHRKAVAQYTKAIESVFIPKNGCLAGCNSNTCLMTPLYARRSFAYAKSGDWKCALRDAEKSVVLDNRNPDVYCIRALVRSSRNDIASALGDVSRALKYNPNHLCALIIKGRLDAPKKHDEWLEPGKKDENLDHKKACSINPDCHNFLTVQDFNHHDILVFYERFLYSLSIPHTICEIVFIPRARPLPAPHVSRVASAKSTDSRITVNSQTVQPQKTSLHNSGLTINSSEFDHQPGDRPFRCGTPVGLAKEQDEKTVQRRRDYSNALREHIARPKTAEDAIAYLEKQRMKRKIAENKAARVRLKPSASYESFPSRITASSTLKMAKPSATEISPPHNTVGTYAARRMTVFQNVNIKDAPRMYYRPWLGDKLPVADVDKKQWITPPFKV